MQDNCEIRLTPAARAMLKDGDIDCIMADAFRRIRGDFYALNVPRGDQTLTAFLIMENGVYKGFIGLRSEADQELRGIKDGQHRGRTNWTTGG